MKRDPSGNGVWSAQTPYGEELPESLQKEITGPQGTGAARVLPLILCVLLLVILLLEGGFFRVRGQMLRRENAVYVPNARQTMQEADQRFTFGPGQRELSVSGRGEDLGRIPQTAADEKLVRVALTIGAMENHTWDWDGAFYLQIDRVYYQNLDGYDLEQTHPEWAMRALNGYELCDTGMEEGWVYFLVPESAQEGVFWMHWLQKDENYNNQAVEAAGVAVSFAQEVTGDA